MTFPDELQYTKDHEWVRIEGGTGVIGISDYAQGELGDVVFVELPQKGKTLKQGDTFGTVEAVKAVSDLYSPLSGEVLEINPALESTPELVNKEPYSGGWMIKIKLSNKGEAGALLNAKSYKELIGK